MQPTGAVRRRVRNEFSRLYASRLYRGARNLGKLETTLHVVDDGVGESSVKADARALEALHVWKLLIANLRGCRNDLSQHDTFEGRNVRYILIQGHWQAYASAVTGLSRPDARENESSSRNGPFRASRT